MPAIIHVEERVVIGTPPYLPAVSIVLPFKLMMSSKSELEPKLKLAVKKVVIEKVLQNCGDVEFIENDMLKDYVRIASIQEY